MARHLLSISDSIFKQRIESSKSLSLAFIRHFFTCSAETANSIVFFEIEIWKLRNDNANDGNQFFNFSHLEQTALRGHPMEISMHNAHRIFFIH